MPPKIPTSILEQLKLSRDAALTTASDRSAYQKAMKSVKPDQQPTFETWLSMRDSVQPKSASLIAAYRDPYAAERGGPSGFTKSNPKISGFLQGVLGNAPDEMGSVLDPLTAEQRKGAEYGFPIGTALQMLPFMKPASIAGKIVGRGALEKLAGAVESGHPLVAPASPMNVVKQPGGQWLKGSVEESLSGLKRGESSPSINDLRSRLAQRLTDMNLNPARVADMTDVDVVRQASTLPEYRNIPAGQMNLRSEGDSALNNWIDKQLVRYVQKDMATPGDPLRALAEKWAVDKPQQLAAAQARLDALNAKGRQIAAERGVPEEYLTRHRQEVIAAEKDKKLLELTDGLHVDSTQLPRAHATVHPSGDVLEKLGKSQSAKAWENASDYTIYPEQAGRFLHTRNWHTNVPTVENNPWLAKVPPETTVYDLSSEMQPRDLGFDHLIDELRNAVNPESGLPPELLLKYENLPKITMPQAVERVAKINAWRAAKKVEADLARANNAATHLHKEYPEAGMRWVELKEPQVNPEAGLHDAEGTFSTLSDALKYEGDTMKHCVGGYCEGVARGDSRIFSLRDANGHPHVTIETNPGSTMSELQEAIYDERGRVFDPEEAVKYAEKMGGGYLSLARDPRPAVPLIKQIKGPSNRAPNAEHLPYVQDFVKSGQWSDVRDLHNSGLVRVQKPVTIRGDGREVVVPPGYHSPEDVKTFFASPDIHPELSDAQTSIFLRRMGMPGYAAGGLVPSTPKGYNPRKLINPRAAQNRNCSCQ